MLSTRVTVIAFLAAAWCWTSEGHLYDVACPGVNSELQCPDNKVIDVLSLATGVRPQAECDNRDVADPKAKSENVHVGMLPWVKFICNNLQRCRLPKPHIMMFTSLTKQSLASNYLQVKYECNAKPQGSRNVVACEGETAELKCESGAISIVKANFGRLDENICVKTPSYMTFCASYNAVSTVMSACTSKTSCKIGATSSELGTPKHCDDEAKYLTVDYICQ